MPDFEPNADSDADRVSLPEAIQAVMDVLEETHAELGAVRRRLGDQDLDPELELNEEALDSPAEIVRHVAARLEGCAGALREASEREKA
ncbi:MAG: hypothetical protein ABEK84_02360 [Salinibacter sp.]